MKRIPILSFLLLVATSAHGQNFVKDNDLSKQVEIGIVEKLGDTIPLDLAFNNENNESVTLRQLINKSTILCFVYYDCPGICPALQMGVSDVVSHLDMELGKDYQIISISFNPLDNPEKAKEIKVNYVQKISVDHRKDWMYLTGTQENISRITEAVGFRYKVQGMGFAHPSAIMIISPAGKITRYLYGLTYLPFDVKMAIIESQKGLARPTINKVMELCFSYNPGSRTYTLQVTRIAGILTLFLAVVILTILLFKGRKKTRNT
ncbi:MAG: SCO family protein [Bacteroidales bacterium]